MLTTVERIDAIRFANATGRMIDIAREHDLSDDDVAFLVSVDVQTIRLIGHFEAADDVDGRTVEAMADRLTRITAHDRMRLAAFRAETEQKPGTYCLARAEPLP